MLNIGVKKKEIKKFKLWNFLKIRELTLKFKILTFNIIFFAEGKDIKIPNVPKKESKKLKDRLKNIR